MTDLCEIVYQRAVRLEHMTRLGWLRVTYHLGGDAKLVAS